MRIAVLLIVVLATGCCAAADTITLAGEWRFDLDPGNVGIRECWFERELSDTVRLPGSTDTNRKGVPNTRPPDLQHPARPFEYTGAAWYQRDVVVPEKWRGMRVTLFLERCHWETQVWLDGKPCGMRDSLCVPHVYDLGALDPGVHRLTIRVDNSIKYNVGNWAHSITEETQTNWNGIVGRVELQARPSYRIESVQVYPDVAGRTIRVRAFVHGDAPTRDGKAVPCVLGYQVHESGAKESGVWHVVDDKITDLTGEKPIEFTVPMPEDVRLWDEFSPSLYTLAVNIGAVDAAVLGSDVCRVNFGMRDLRVQDRRFVLNGRRIFLRGTLECCIFPKTGYPPTDVDSWMRILRICRSYGLNHMRFHSWCPPKAAFEAADRLGFLLQVELPQWVGNVGQEAPRDEFIRSEMMRILDTYGSHPSFGMLCMGNELSGDAAFLQKLVVEGKAYDPRHLYTSSTAWSFGGNDDYNVAIVRGLHGPTTDRDFAAQTGGKVPIISHEIAQWSVFPNLAEIPKYKGVTRARNFELIRDQLREHGILDRAADFTRASGKLSAELYKEEIEVLLRTPGHGGFQLLDLHDFPGQGTALVGMLDAFWDSKDLIEPAEWRRFCGPTVPLLRMGKRSWTADETFSAGVQVSHFGPEGIQVEPTWAIRNDRGRKIASGEFPAQALPTGDLYDLGTIAASLENVQAPCRLTVTVSLKGADASNNWSIWVYPSEAAVNQANDVLLTRSIADCKAALDGGRKVLFLASRSTLVDPGNVAPTTVFWSPILFTHQNRHGMGILCDPGHPALAGFPTDSHADWQWWDLLEKSVSMPLDGTPKDFRPVVQVIDNFIRNRKMGNLIEARVGRGRLMVCSMNLTGDRPAQRQMMRSILGYMASPKFDPKQELSNAELDTFLADRKPSAVQSLGAKVIHADSEDPANPAVNAIDDDPGTIWHTEWQATEPPFPHEIQVDLQKVVTLTGFTCLPRQDIRNGWFTDYEFYVSDDGKSWGAPVAKGLFAADEMVKSVRFDRPVRGRFIRMVGLRGWRGNPWMAVAELDVMAAM